MGGRRDDKSDGLSATVAAAAAARAIKRGTPGRRQEAWDGGGPSARFLQRRILSPRSRERYLNRVNAAEVRIPAAAVGQDDQVRAVQRIGGVALGDVQDDGVGAQAAQ